ncbi:MAG: AMP-binding enzyme, partial [Longimicrobiales bacterium]
AVVGIETMDGLTKPEAFVLLESGAKPGIEEALQRHVKERLEPYKYPRSVHILEDLPRTHLGKVDRGQLKRRGESC